jgi:hypothetical protein
LQRHSISSVGEAPLNEPAVTDHSASVSSPRPFLQGVNKGCESMWVQIVCKRITVFCAVRGILHPRKRVTNSGSRAEASMSLTTKAPIGHDPEPFNSSSRHTCFVANSILYSRLPLGLPMFHLTREVFPQHPILFLLFYLHAPPIIVP